MTKKREVTLDEEVRLLRLLVDELYKCLEAEQAVRIDYSKVRTDTEVKHIATRVLP